MMQEQITVTGFAVDIIGRGERASFYGILGNHPDCATAMRVCCNEVERHLDRTGIDWDWFEITSANVIQTDARHYSAIIRYNRH